MRDAVFIELEQILISISFKYLLDRQPRKESRDCEVYILLIPDKVSELYRSKFQVSIRWFVEAKMHDFVTVLEGCTDFCVIKLLMSSKSCEDKALLSSEKSTLEQTKLLFLL